MRMLTLTGVAICLALTAIEGRADEGDSDLAVVTPELPRPETSPTGLQDVPDTPPRRIGELDWHTSYTAAFKQARTEQKMLFLFFRDEQNPRIADIYEQEVLNHADLAEPLADVVRVVLPLD
ncbi:MAG TPA: hypothetical protein VL475_04985, partial [Planctomycetaceae bacterium]|nr:hypothetical protein [Planctomycetaceae bacterium]